jgi:hypothetical protein
MRSIRGPIPHRQQIGSKERVYTRLHVEANRRQGFRAAHDAFARGRSRHIVRPWRDVSHLLGCHHRFIRYHLLLLDRPQLGAKARFDLQLPVRDSCPPGPSPVGAGSIFLGRSWTGALGNLSALVPEHSANSRLVRWVARRVRHC